MKMFQDFFKLLVHVIMSGVSRLIRVLLKYSFQSLELQLIFSKEIKVVLNNKKFFCKEVRVLALLATHCRLFDKKVTYISFSQLVLRTTLKLLPLIHCVQHSSFKRQFICLNFYFFLCF